MIIGHRGASAHAPENTIAAFELALNGGADGLEFDVRLARDGVPVVFHDETLDRMGGIAASVESLTSAELASIDVGKLFRNKNQNRTADARPETVPTLAGTLERFENFPGELFIELKCTDADAERLTDAVCEVVKLSSLLPQVIIKSFKLAVIPRVRSQLASVRTAALFAPKIMTILRKEKHLVTLAKEFGADELSMHYSLATRKLCDRAAAHGMPVHVWTVNNPRWVKRAYRLGIRSLITDDPAALVARRAALFPENRS